MTNINYPYNSLLSSLWYRQPRVTSFSPLEWCRVKFQSTFNKIKGNQCWEERWDAQSDYEFQVKSMSSALNSTWCVCPALSKPDKWNYVSPEKPHRNSSSSFYICLLDSGVLALSWWSACMLCFFSIILFPLPFKLIFYHLIIKNTFIISNHLDCRVTSFANVPWVIKLEGEFCME